VSIEGNNLHFYRLDLGLTLREMAERTGVSVSHLSEMERGVNQMSVDVLRRIAKGLEVSPADLLRVIPQVKWETCPACDGRGMVRHPHRVDGLDARDGAA
jgi:transcriptional regulator with XRE-family HTH domain